MADVVLIREAREMADALDDERGGADRFAAARLLRRLAKRIYADGEALCGNCGVTYNRYDKRQDDNHGIGLCGISSSVSTLRRHGVRND